MEPARDAVVRPIARSVARPCARPGCRAPAAATLSFRYPTREAWMSGLADRASPETYDLCRPHADRTRPPHDWQLVDRRPVDGSADASGPEGSGGDGTVAVLAAALRAVPDAAEAPPTLGAEQPPITIEDPPRPDGEDHDLEAALSALVTELEARSELEADPDDPDDPAGPDGAAEHW